MPTETKPSPCTKSTAGTSWSGACLTWVTMERRSTKAVIEPRGQWKRRGRQGIPRTIPFETEMFMYGVMMPTGVDRGILVFRLTP
jgi:hypothetical protein